MAMEHNEVLEASINLCRQVIDKVSVNLLVGLFNMRNLFISNAITVHSQETCWCKPNQKLLNTACCTSFSMPLL